ncbi:MAG: hypothetical protein COA62_08135 [Rhodobiaceae bacterium]|nr:MAG: hypothetical protein COA62_08135 [Rhodobiaceae bacterium]
MIVKKSEQDSWEGPVFVVGPSRSGTAMMRSVLNSHSAVALAGETHYFDDLRTRKGFEPGVRLTSENASHATEYFRALDDRPYGMKGDPQKSPISNQAMVEQASASSTDIDADAYFEAYCRLTADRQHKNIWGEKTPRHVFRLKEILTKYPQAKVLCMVRDPRAVVASYRDWQNQGGLNTDSEESFKQAIKEEEQRARLSYNIVIATLLWRAAINAAFAAQRQFGAERVMVLRYEDVVNDSSASVRSLCDWLSIEFEEGMLNIPMQNSSFVKFSKNTGITNSYLEKWREILSGREISIIQSFAGKVLDRSGYEKAGPNAGVGALLTVLVTLPLHVIRAAAVNRQRIGNMYGYITRRLVGIFRG